MVKIASTDITRRINLDSSAATGASAPDVLHTVYFSTHLQTTATTSVQNCKIPFFDIAFILFSSTNDAFVMTRFRRGVSLTQTLNAALCVG